MFINYLNQIMVKFSYINFREREFILEISVGKITITSQTFFKILFPLLLLATLFLIITSIISKESVFSGVNIVAIGSTCLSYYFSKHS